MRYAYRLDLALQPPILPTMKQHPAVLEYLAHMASKGGKARAAKLSKARRSEIAAMGTIARERKKAAKLQGKSKVTE